MPLGFNPMDLGSVRGLYLPPRGLNKPGRVAEPRWSLASWTKHPAGVMLRINWQCPTSASHKLQAASLTADPGYGRMDLERNNYGQ